ncbi:MAG: UDP-N-acetylmuramoyl-tripeptide--D-alanyl-D-alanine ligase [Cyclobacteriaceae bacterium]|nr:UDP-N-acetylmuramoyl-tripeptide--D-alanyl-D-alanine ligase [Cyclobacteriaceae bacterium]
MTIEELYKLFKESEGVSTDSRKITTNSIFFALKGEHFNGNQFAAQAIAQGASYAVVDEETEGPTGKLIKVENVLETLQNLATYHRRQFSIPVIGITGSNGKTTTKELIASVLGSALKVHFTQGNFNNHIGVPLTLLSTPVDTEIAVIEMGANHVGEIAALCKIAEPTHGIITNIGKAHLEGFGGYEGVLRGKTELYDHVLQKGETVFINSEDKVLSNMAKRFKAPVMFPAPGDFFTCSFVEASPYVVFEVDGTSYTTQLIGKYNYNNIAGALAIGKYFNVPLQGAIEAVCNYIPSNNRSQVKKTERNTLILDAYNANPGSMKASVENFAGMKADSKTVILGDMLELGTSSKEEHAAIGQLVYEKGFNAAFFCGKEMRSAAKKCIGCMYFEKKEDLANYLQANPINNSTVLIKASRGIGLETLVEFL